MTRGRGLMKLPNSVLRGLVFVAAALSPMVAGAQGADRLGSSFAIVAQPVDSGTVQVAKQYSAFFKFDAPIPGTQYSIPSMPE